jgi:hypothetical protein
MRLPTAVGIVNSFAQQMSCGSGISMVENIETPATVRTSTNSSASFFAIAFRFFCRLSRKKINMLLQLAAEVLSRFLRFRLTLKLTRRALRVG